MSEDPDPVLTTTTDRDAEHACAPAGGPHRAGPAGPGWSSSACWPCRSRPTPPPAPHRSCPATNSTPAAADASATRNAAPSTARWRPAAIVKGYEYAPGQFFVLDEAELKHLRPPATAPWTWTASSTWHRSIRCSSPAAASI